MLQGKNVTRTGKRKRVLEQPKVSADIFAWLQAGKAPIDVLALLKSERGIVVSHQALYGFIKRHKIHITQIQQRAADEVIDLAIRDKAERVRRLSELYDRAQALIESRGGIEAVDVKFAPASGRQIEVRRFDAALYKEMRGLLRDVAEELGEIPKPPLVEVNDNSKHLTVLAQLTVDELRALAAQRLSSERDDANT